MDDRQFEDRLRRALHAEVEGLPVNVTAATIQRRNAQRQRLPRLAWAVVGLAAGLVVAAGIFAVLNRPSAPLVGATPTPTPTAAAATTAPAATATPGGQALNESAGRLQVTFDWPMVPRTSGTATCQWAPTEPLRVDRIGNLPSNELQVLGEQLGILILVDDPDAPDLIISRSLPSGEERAPYSPEPPAGFTTDAPGDRRAGTMTFLAIDTLADDYPVDALPLPRGEFGRPLGDEPSADLISGTIRWECDPPQAAFDPPPPSPSASPTAGIDAPSMELRASTETRTGASLCWSMDDYRPVGQEPCDAWVSPNDYPEPLPVEPGGELRLGPNVGWGLRSWRIVASTYEEIERTFGKPEVETILSEKSGPGTVSDLPAAFQAPTTPGLWIMRATVALKGEGAPEASGTYLFVLDVQQP